MLKVRMKKEVTSKVDTEVEDTVEEVEDQEEAEHTDQRLQVNIPRRLH